MQVLVRPGICSSEMNKEVSQDLERNVTGFTVLGQNRYQVEDEETKTEKWGLGSCVHSFTQVCEGTKNIGLACAAQPSVKQLVQ